MGKSEVLRKSKTIMSMDKDDESMYSKVSGKSFAQFKIEDAIKKLKKNKADNEKFKEFAGDVRRVSEVHLPAIRPLILTS